MTEIPIKWELESGWQSEIVKTAKKTGNRAYHTFNSRKSEPGFPDLTIYGPVGFLMVETKRVKTRCTDEQLETGARLIEVGVDWRVWRPQDWDEVVATFATRGNKFHRWHMYQATRWAEVDHVAEAREEKCGECGLRVTTVYVRTVGGSWILADGRSAPLCGGCLMAK